MEDTLRVGLVLLVSALALCESAPYYGKRIGEFSRLQHQVSGTVYFATSTHIVIDHFNYDGQGPDAFFWIGTNSTSENKAASDGTWIPNEEGNYNVLGAYYDKTVYLKLPTGVKVHEIKWLSVWCRQFAANFGELVLQSVGFKEADVPRRYNLGPISRLAHQVRTDGDIFIENHRTFLIEELYYDGYGPDAFFIVGTGNTVGAPGTYIKLLDETGSPDKIHRYNGETIRIQVPVGKNILDFDYFAMYCIMYTQNFGDVKIPPGDLNIPVYFEPKPTTTTTTTTVAPQIQPWDTSLANCENMHKKVNVGWQIEDDTIKIEHISVTGDGEYMAFGLSGSMVRTAMVMGDVTVTYFDDASGKPSAVDYYLSAYAQCSNGNGACPDKTRGSSNDVTVVVGSRENGLTKVTYTRKLNTGDTKSDHTFPAELTHYIWSLGGLDREKIVTKHHTRIMSPVKLALGRSPVKNCAPLDVPTMTAPPPVGWPPLTIDGTKVFEFVVRMGPTGGDKGYKFITGQQSWGIAYYINGLLIPELTLVRGLYYTFKIEAGDDPSNTARNHPFYITDDPKGGFSQYSQMEKLTKNVYLGIEPDGSPSSSAVGKYCEYEQLGPVDTVPTSATFEDYFQTLTLNCPTAGVTGVMIWKPGPSTPDLLYYHCYTHFRLGWKIHVIDSPTDTTTTTTTTTPVPTPEPSTTTTRKTTIVGISGERSVHYSACTQGFLVALFTAVMFRNF